MMRSRGAPMGSSQGERPFRKKRNQICEFWKEPRGCIKGETCEFMHSEPRSQACHWFNSAGGCRKGDKCDFQHISEKSGDHRDRDTHDSGSGDSGDKSRSEST